MWSLQSQILIVILLIFARIAKSQHTVSWPQFSYFTTVVMVTCIYSVKHMCLRFVLYNQTNVYTVLNMFYAKKLAKHFSKIAHGLAMHAKHLQKCFRLSAVD